MLTTTDAPAHAERLTTSVEVRPAATPGAPPGVRSVDGLLAVRTVGRAPDAAAVALVAAGAVLLGGDHIELRIDVADGCALSVTDVGGTVAYDGEGAPARWDVVVRLGRAARLTWFGMPFVVADGADVDRSLHARLGRASRMVLRETVVLGRSGEQGGRIQLRTEVHDDVGPILVEDVTAAGARPVPGVLGDHRVMDSVMVVQASADGDGSLAAPPPLPPPLREEELLPDLSSVPGATHLRLDRSGDVVRWLGPHAHLSPIQHALTTT